MRWGRVPTAIRVSLLCVACTHTDAVVTSSPESNGPFTSGSDVQLTFSADQEYWPTWTEDGRGILYAYVDPALPLHRCIGLIPAAGGTRTWQLCDTRASQVDTISSYSAFALGSDGRLIYMSATSTSLSSFPAMTLWLADSASPFVRKKLLTLPLTVGTTGVTWIADLAWTGPNTFIGLGQQFNTLAHCVEAPLSNGQLATHCDTRDSVWIDGGIVFRGIIENDHATLTAIAGTEGALGFSLAEADASIVFSHWNDPHLYRLPAAGGIPTVVASNEPPHIGLILGVSCKGVVCIFAQDSATPFNQQGIHFYWAADQKYVDPRGAMQLHRLSLTSGADEILVQNEVHAVYSTPKISPISGDVVTQVGGGWGHLQTFATQSLTNLFNRDGNSTLHLFKNVIP